LARLVAALTVATALRLAASAAGTFTIAAARLARAVALLAAVSMHLVVAFGARNALADQLFDRNHRLLVERRDDRDRRAGAAGTTGAADAMDVIVGMVGDVEIEDVADLGNVEAAGGDVGGDQ